LINILPEPLKAKIAVDNELDGTIILRLCQKSPTLACPPVHRLLFMFSDQSNMPRQRINS